MLSEILMEDAVWISWELHRRNQSMSKKLGVKLLELVDTCRGLRRYYRLLYRTANVLVRERPRIVFVQNPSLVLAFFVVIVGRLAGRIVVVDAHNIGIYFEHRHALTRRIGQLLNNVIVWSARLIIVTNTYLAERVEQLGGRGFVLPDPFPEFANHKRVTLKGVHNVLFICSYADDEPYMELVEGANGLRRDVYVYVTGDHKGKELPETPPENVIFTGYLPNEVYIDYLHSVDVIVDLTFRENCMVAGAYEGVSAEKGLVLSDKTVLREYFGEAAVYTDNSSEDICRKIEIALKRSTVLSKNAKEIKFRKSVYWDERRVCLEGAIRGLSMGGGASVLKS